MKGFGKIKFTKLLLITLPLWLGACKSEVEDATAQLAPLLLATPQLQSTNQSSCAGDGALRLFTDPMPDEKEIQVIQLGESVILDQENNPGSPNLVWDFLAGTEYQGFFTRYARHVQAEQCAAYTPVFPGYHYLKLCNSTTCLARGIFKVEGVMNRAPHAALEEVPLVAKVGSNVRLDMSATTDPEDDPLTFTWTVQIKPQGSQAVAPTSGPAVQEFFPDLPGKYFLMGRAKDGFENPFRFLDEANSHYSALFFARLPNNEAPTINLIRTPVSPTETAPIHFDATTSTDPDDAVLRIHYWALVRVRDDGVRELDRESDQFAPGQLTFEISPTAGNYEIYVCLADYVGREFGLDGEEQSCTAQEFTVGQ